MKRVRKTESPKFDEKLREIGQKARQRLEEEKSKRKEIVRLDDEAFQVHGAVKKASSASAFSKSIVKNSSKPKSSQQKSSVKRRRLQTSTYSSETTSKIEDSWCPSCEGLNYYDLPKEQKSNFVRLHGLPEGTKVEHINKFFKGLEPEYIGVLLSANINIQAFDCDEGEVSPNSSIDRYDSTFRVVVKFQSVLIAENAISRSGERIVLENEDGQHISVAISISPISKQVAMFVKNNLMIKCIKGQSISNQLENAQNNVPIVINQLMWVAAAKKTGIDLYIKSIGGKGGFPRVKTDRFFSLGYPIDDEEKLDLIDLHNNILDMYEQLEKVLSPFAFDHKIINIYDLSFGSMNCITNNAAMLLIDQMNKIQNCLSHCKI
ncbi:hypothetical protein CTEN210_07695 [Chaetoceros tenuissimus]|uniref:Uncharacterized protein n=1 Tax=Chaetoceros tenuissimus TaxID=426638 RepID=A0AAD3CSY0_9STRA|nr:hypothetical protein CTEN210_07695 [Chaetoceros tenuissimus]